MNNDETLTIRPVDPFAGQTPERCGNWLFTKYDALGRVIMTGLYNDGRERQDIQNAVNGLTNYTWWELRSGSGVGYTANVFPQTIAYYHSLNFYDDYDFPGNVFGGPNTGLGQVTAERTKGLLTGSANTVLGTGYMLQTVNYYNADGRVIQSKSQHYKGGVVSAGNYDEVTNTYKFTGDVATSTRKHFVGGTESLYVFNEYTYDNMGRKIDSRQKTGDNSGTGNPLVILSREVYNEVGQLKTKSLHAPNPLSPVFAKDVSYTYNERGWLSSQNAPSLFNQLLIYNESLMGVTRNYNGNISRQEWMGSKYFNYSYDALNRLESSVSNEGDQESLNYDAMGNIQTLTRYAATVLKDELTYNYSGTGNKLNSVSDASGDSNGMFQLPGTTNYGYDLNGNMTSRTNSSYPGNNISGITYNYLNLPSSMNANGSSIMYTYDAAGNKLKKVVTGAGNLNNEYIGGIHYEGGVLKFVSTEAGRVVRNSATDYSYEYTLTDHLGNGRVFFNINSSGVATKIQETDYYAFGLEIPRYSFGTDSKYLYNGKEKQDQEKMYDYGARFYDPVIGRWNVVDPLAELDRKTSPYAYVFNNPLRFIDPTGMKGEDWVEDGNGNPYWDPNVTSADDTDLNGRNYLGKTYEYESKGGRVRLNDVDNLENGQNRWEYVGVADYGRQLQRGMEGPSLSDEISKLKPVLNVAEAISTGTAYVASGGVGAVEAGTAYAAGIAGRRAAFMVGLRMAEIRALGLAGETAVGIGSVGKQVIEVGGRSRIPDRIANGFLEEVKNVRYQSFTRQLRDFYQYSSDKGLQMILHTRPNTIISKPLKNLIDQGKILHEFIPGL